MNYSDVKKPIIIFFTDGHSETFENFDRASESLDVAPTTLYSALLSDRCIQSAGGFITVDYLVTGEKDV